MIYWTLSDCWRHIMSLLSMVFCHTPLCSANALLRLFHPRHIYEGTRTLGSSDADCCELRVLLSDGLVSRFASCVWSFEISTRSCELCILKRQTLLRGYIMPVSWWTLLFIPIVHTSSEIFHSWHYFWCTCSLHFYMECLTVWLSDSLTICLSDCLSDYLSSLLVGWQYGCSSELRAGSPTSQHFHLQPERTEPCAHTRPGEWTCHM